MTVTAGTGRWDGSYRLFSLSLDWERECALVVFTTDWTCKTCFEKIAETALSPLNNRWLVSRL